MAFYFLYLCQAQKTTPLDTMSIEKIIGIKGKVYNGEYKITIPQNDLSIEVDGLKLFRQWV